MIKRIDEKDLPELPEGWRWDNSYSRGDQRCWDAIAYDVGCVEVYEADDIEVNNAPPEVVALVKFANGLSPDPRLAANKRPTSDNRARAIALLEAAIALLEES